MVEPSIMEHKRGWVGMGLGHPTTANELRWMEVQTG